MGWTVGGYLFAALLGVSKGARPATVRRAAQRLLAAVPYAVLSGLGGAAIVGPLLGALTGHFLALWGIGALAVFGAAAVTIALQVLFGVLGIGVTVLLFVVLGNPSAGGAYGPELLPPFWRATSPPPSPMARRPTPYATSCTSPATAPPRTWRCRPPTRSAGSWSPS
ncbi:hypothetical protein ABZU86_30850 [Streptomyces sp. NPDC005271]|uniref:hypothetical protein n=1 Tax=unclassified Streptomyces TaxID=2593676 RepID=UPI0033B9DDC4